MYKVPKSREDAFCTAVRQAVHAQLMMWDALSAAEEATAGVDDEDGTAEISASDLSVLSADLSEPEDADNLEDAAILEWFDFLQSDDSEDDE